MSGTRKALTLPAAITRGPSASRLSVHRLSCRTDRIKVVAHLPLKRNHRAVATRRWFAANQAKPAPRIARMFHALGWKTAVSSERGGTWARFSTRAAAAKDTAYCETLNSARHGAWRSRKEDTTTAAACTVTAIASPQPNSNAKVNAMDGKTVAARIRPGVANGRASTSTANAAMSHISGSFMRTTSGRSRYEGATTMAAATTTRATYEYTQTARSLGTRLRMLSASTRPASTRRSASLCSRSRVPSELSRAGRLPGLRG
jgi:hypothetical protein